jgi:hypothetical protein
MDQTIWHDAEEIDHFLGYTAAHFLEKIMMCQRYQFARRSVNISRRRKILFLS